MSEAGKASQRIYHPKELYFLAKPKKSSPQKKYAAGGWVQGIQAIKNLLRSRRKRWGFLRLDRQLKEWDNLKDRKPQALYNKSGLFGFMMT